MLNLTFRFPGGRYHATPWGRHVNEGAIEWPPSPWRLCRALLATGFARLGWTEVPEAGHTLIAALSGTTPTFFLPPASTGHTRHYMPLYQDKTTKVLDTFVWLGSERALGVQWDVMLDDESLALLRSLLGSLSYLGRAEAWVEAEVVDTLPDGLDRCPEAELPPGTRLERVPLLAPMPEAEYAGWRAAALDRALTEALASKQRTATDKGKKVPDKLTPADTRKVQATLPASLVEALLADTASLRKAGWSQPPGTRWLSYWRPEGALVPQVSANSAPRRAEGPRVQAVVLALSTETRHSNVLPLLNDTIRRTYMLHQGLVSASAKTPGSRTALFGGQDETGRPLRGHRHVSITALSLGTQDDGAGRHSPGRARIDHLLLHCPEGLGEAELQAVRAVPATYAKNRPTLHLSVVGQGSAQELAADVPALSAAQVWVSATPFVPPRHLKRGGKNSLVGQVQAELQSRGLPAATTVEFEVAGEARWREGAVFHDVWRQRLRDSSDERPVRLATRWRDFRITRPTRGDRPDAPAPPQPLRLSLRLSFSEPLQGPLSLGYASHFGLGAFVPADARGSDGGDE